jgi:hypothetical protein
MPFLGIYQKKCKPVYKRDPSIPVFIAALFTIAKNQSRCPPTDEWIKM